MLRLGAALPLWRTVCRHFGHPRVREAFSFHSLFIGGAPVRVRAIYGALVYRRHRLQRLSASGAAGRCGA
jgi:phytoene desaturase